MTRPRQILTILLGAMLTVAVWSERGAIDGIVALAVYGGLSTASALQHERLTAWSTVHPTLDSALLAPLAFLAVAYLTELPLALCLAIGVSAWLVAILVKRVREHKTGC